LTTETCVCSQKMWATSAIKKTTQIKESPKGWKKILT
jgi:hypothetical protein